MSEQADVPASKPAGHWVSASINTMNYVECQGRTDLSQGQPVAVSPVVEGDAGLNILPPQVLPQSQQAPCLLIHAISNLHAVVPCSSGSACN